MSRAYEAMAKHAAYSWRSDPTVPAFDDRRPLIVFDGVCVFCSRSMRWIAAADKQAQMQFTAAQSDLGQALFRHFGLDPATFETMLFLHGGQALGKRAAIVAIGPLLKWPWRIAFAAWHWLPQMLADRAYDGLANRRYRLFGRYETCFVPDPSWRARVID